MSEGDRIRIGNQTAFSAPTIAEPFEYAAANGFDAFEWFPDKKESGAGWETADLDKEMRETIERKAVEHDIRLSVHASWQANPLDQETHDLLLEQFEFAREIGAKIFNIHLYPEEGIETFIRSIDPLAERLAAAGMRLSVENTPLTPPEDFNELFDRLRKSSDHAAERIGMCLDLGHANLCEKIRNDYLRYVDLLDPLVPIVHVHVHENYGDSDSHLPLFTGPSKHDPSGVEGFIQRLKARRFSGSIILEQWPQPPELLKEARERLLDLFGENGAMGGKKKAVHESRPDSEPPKEGDFVGMLVHGNRDNRSWREKLGFVHDILTNEALVPDVEMLAYLAIYLRFIGTGEIPSLEEGGHHRPSHHARMAGRIYDRLAKIATVDSDLIVRKIYPWLPSFNSAFTSAEPLTRIRDIAHRNDIPHELKNEIKHTLQNKLHRNAGPEDLVTSEALLKRITAPESDYPETFVEEFKKFHEELKEFFNARSLDQDLKALIPEAAPEESKLIRDFLRGKDQGETPGQLTETLERLTVLRRRFSRKAAGKDATAQRLQIADIRLEDFSFVAMSRLVNQFLGEGIEWGSALRALLFSVEGLRSSGFDPEECLAVEAELKALKEVFDPRSHELLIRLKATLERCRRLAEDYSDRIVALFSEKVEKLGTAMGVPEHAIRVFVEADIRRHPVFQLSKLASLLLREIRNLTALPSWSVIVPGKAFGLLRHLVHLEEQEYFFDEPVLALLEKVEGDEEIPAGLVGVVAAHEVPLLSHLAVRARQRKILFVVCEDEDAFEELVSLTGKRIRFSVGGGSVPTWKVLPDLEGGTLSGKGEAAHPSPPFLLPEVDLTVSRKLIPLGELVLQNGGNKALGGRRLEALSNRKEAGFKVPHGVVVPFGVMEEAIRSDRELAGSYFSLMRRIDSIPYDDLEQRLGQLRDIVMRVKVPEEILSGTRAEFKENERLMVRSSSNGEDLGRISGAGLYESVANVPLSGVGEAVKEVWASLWTKRATMSRRIYGIPHESAHMAVFIQQMLIPELCFILHTFNPANRNSEEVFMELAVGLGETLASGRMQGSPYRLVYDKHRERLQILSFANYSKALWPGREREVRQETVDYSGISFTSDSAFRERLGIRLGRVGRFVENAIGSPQDIEGLYREDSVYLVQTRPQQGEGVDEL